MTLAVRLLDSGASDVDATSYVTTGLVATPPVPGSLVLACIRVLDLTSQAQAPTIAGMGLTWNDSGSSDNATTTPRMQVHRAYADPALLTSGQITWSAVVSAATADGAQWMVIEITDQAQGVGATLDGVSDVQSNQVNVDTISVTMSGTSVTGASLMCGFYGGHDIVNGAFAGTPGTGYTAVGDRIDTIGGTSNRITFEYQTRAAAGDTVVDATMAAANDRMQMIGLAVAQAPAVRRPVYAHDRVVDGLAAMNRLNRGRW